MRKLITEDLSPADSEAVEQAASLLVEAFRGHTDAWPDWRPRSTRSRSRSGGPR